VYYDKPGWSEFKKASPCECEEFDTGRFQDWDLKFSRGPDTQMKCPKTTLSRTEDSSLTNHRHRKRGKWMGVKVQTHMVMPGASDKQPDCNYVLSQQSFHIWGHMQFMQSPKWTFMLNVMRLWIHAHKCPVIICLSELRCITMDGLITDQCDCPTDKQRSDFCWLVRLSHTNRSECWSAPSAGHTHTLKLQCNRFQGQWEDRTYLSKLFYLI